MIPKIDQIRPATSRFRRDWRKARRAKPAGSTCSVRVRWNQEGAMLRRLILTFTLRSSSILTTLTTLRSSSLGSFHFDFDGIERPSHVKAKRIQRHRHKSRSVTVRDIGGLFL